jgi:hypothetical protein
MNGDLFGNRWQISALPIGDRKADISDRQLRATFRTHAPQQTTACLFDHLVGGGEEGPWHVEAERFGGLHIDD